MAEFFAEYGLFLLKVITIVVGIVVVIAFAASAGRKASHEGLEVEDLNSRYKTLSDALLKAVSTKEEHKKASKARKKEGEGGAQDALNKATQFRCRLQGRPESQRGFLVARRGERDTRCRHER
jgi:serine protease SohB